MKRDATGQREQHQPMDKNMTKTNTSEMLKENVKAVMFVPYTVGSMLAKRMRAGWDFIWTSWGSLRDRPDISPEFALKKHEDNDRKCI